MEDIGIREIARQIGEIADEKLLGREGCATFTDNEIVLCVKDEPGFQATGVTFDADTPRMILTAAMSIINRMIFNLSPIQSSAIVASTIPNVFSLRREQPQFVHQQ